VLRRRRARSTSHTSLPLLPRGPVPPLAAPYVETEQDTTTSWHAVMFFKKFISFLPELVVCNNESTAFCPGLARQSPSMKEPPSIDPTNQQQIAATALQARLPLCGVHQPPVTCDARTPSPPSVRIYKCRRSLAPPRRPLPAPHPRLRPFSGPDPSHTLTAPLARARRGRRSPRRAPSPRPRTT